MKLVSGASTAQVAAPPVYDDSDCTYCGERRLAVKFWGGLSVTYICKPCARGFAAAIVDVEKGRVMVKRR